MKKYEVVNKDLNIMSCRLADLTMDQVQCFLLKLRYDAPISELVLFTEEDTGAVVLNRDHKDYDFYLSLAEVILQDSDEQLEKDLLIVPDAYNETADMLIQCRTRRRILKDMAMLENQDLICYKESYEGALFKALEKKYYDLPILLSMVYNYGLIKGKRAERAVRKAAREV